MNPGLIVKLRPSGPWRIGPDSGARNRVDVVYHSDSLYSAVTAAMARLGWLEEWLDATARPGAPSVSFSSCFPYMDEIGFVVPPRTIWPPASPSARAARVRWKSARFVPITVVQTILSGRRLDENQWTVDGASDCLVPNGRPGPFRTAVRTAAAVDRLTGATERHSAGCIEFRPGSGLWTVVSFADDAAMARWCDPVRAAFRLLADSGFGGERSRGWGRSEAPEFQDGMLPDMILPPVVRVSKASVKAATPVAAMVQPTPGKVAAPLVEAAPPAAEEIAVPVAEAAPAAEVVEIAEVAPVAEAAETAEAVSPAAEQVAASAADVAPVAESVEFAEAVSPAAEELAVPVAEAVPATEVAPAAEVAAPAPDEIAAPVAEAAETAEAAAPAPEEIAVPVADVAPVAEAAATAEAAPPAAAEAAPAADVAPVAESVEIAEVASPVAEEFAAPAAEAAPAAATPTYPHWLLSVFTPAAADAVDWQRGNYTVLTRAGRVDSPAGSGELKKQIQMVAEGSVVYAETAPRGSAANVAPDGFAHPVFRAGFAVAIPLPEVI